MANALQTSWVLSVELCWQQSQRSTCHCKKNQ